MRASETLTLGQILEQGTLAVPDKIAHHKLPTELSIMIDFPKLSGGGETEKIR